MSRTILILITLLLSNLLISQNSEELKSIEEKFQELIEKAEQGDTDAQFDLAKSYYLGIDV